MSNVAELSSWTPVVQKKMGSRQFLRPKKAKPLANYVTFVLFSRQKKPKFGQNQGEKLKKNRPKTFFQTSQLCLVFYRQEHLLEIHQIVHVYPSHIWVNGLAMGLLRNRKMPKSHAALTFLMLCSLPR